LAFATSTSFIFISYGTLNIKRIVAPLWKCASTRSQREVLNSLAKSGSPRGYPPLQSEEPLSCSIGRWHQWIFDFFTKLNYTFNGN
jgi:hypothetical protein